MKIKLAFRIAMITVIVLITGCSEDWLDEKPPQLISTASLYTTLSGFEAGLNGMYALVRQERKEVMQMNQHLLWVLLTSSGTN